jgi:hypothetical protein
MGYSPHFWTKGEHCESTVAQMARNGARIRVLIMAPDNPELAAFVNDGQIAGITLHAAMVAMGRLPAGSAEVRASRS